MRKILAQEMSSINYTPERVRHFSLLMGGILLVLTIITWWTENQAYALLGMLTISFLVAGILFPKFLYPVYKIWMGFAIIIGFIMSRIILTIFFFAAITPIGFFGRLFSKQFLKTRKPVTTSFWNQRKDTKQNFTNQF